MIQILIVLCMKLASNETITRIGEGHNALRTLLPPNKEKFKRPFYKFFRKFIWVTKKCGKFSPPIEESRFMI